MVVSSPELGHVVRCGGAYLLMEEDEKLCLELAHGSLMGHPERCPVLGFWRGLD